MNQIAIQCKGIKKSYGQDETLVEALKDINVEIYQGELTLLVGPSGSGKTTLLSIITNILTPNAGELFILGHNLNQMSESQKTEFCRNNLGIVFQSLFLVPTLTVAENVTLPLLVGGSSQKTAYDKSIQILEKLHIAHKANFSPATLSKGQQQRVAIARAMVNESKIIVCDEPTSALDQAAGLEVMTLLKELVKNSGKTVVVVTHDHRIFSFADRMINMSDGQIISGQEK